MQSERFFSRYGVKFAVEFLVCEQFGKGSFLVARALYAGYYIHLVAVGIGEVLRHKQFTDKENFAPFLYIAIVK